MLVLGNNLQCKVYEILEIDFEEAMLLYHSFMGGVDNFDTLWDRSAGFNLKEHFKKWYNKSYLGILDLMCLNSIIDWNMLTWMDDSLHHNEVKKWRFMMRLMRNSLIFGTLFHKQRLLKKVTRLKWLKNQQSRASTKNHWGATPITGQTSEEISTLCLHII